MVTNTNRIGAVRLDDDHFLLLYVGSVSGTGTGDGTYAVIGTVSGAVISWSTPTRLTTTKLFNFGLIAIDAAGGVSPSSIVHCVLGYTDAGQGFTQELTVTSMTTGAITAGSPAMFSADAGNPTYLTAFDSTHFALTYETSTNRDYVLGGSLISGTFAFGTPFWTENQWPEPYLGRNTARGFPVALAALDASHLLAVVLDTHVVTPPPSYSWDNFCAAVVFDFDPSTLALTLAYPTLVRVTDNAAGLVTSPPSLVRLSAATAMLMWAPYGTVYGGETHDGVPPPPYEGGAVSLVSVTGDTVTLATQDFFVVTDALTADWGGPTIIAGDFVGSDTAVFAWDEQNGDGNGVGFAVLATVTAALTAKLGSSRLGRLPRQAVR